MNLRRATLVFFIGCGVLHASDIPRDNIARAVEKATGLPLFSVVASEIDSPASIAGECNGLKVISRRNDPVTLTTRFVLRCGSYGLPFVANVRLATSITSGWDRAGCKPGEKARLVRESGGMRITLAVTCTREARIGDVIALRSADRRKYYRGRLVGPGQFAMEN